VEGVALIEASLQGLLSVFEWPAFGLMLLGIAVGFMVGILPGLGGPAALALMLPFTLGMKPVEAFAFLLGMLSVTSTTGDLTSVLFGVPGEGSTAATVVDGYPMTKQGEAGRALGAALMSSLVGAILGAVAMALLVPVVQPVVLAFGPPEFFMLALVGIAFLASVTGGAVRRGVIAGGLGFLLSFVGLDPLTGAERYTFGQLYLLDGVKIIPVVIGLFAVPEILDMAAGRGSIAQQAVGKLGGVLEGVKDTFRHWWMVVRCSLIGLYIGIVPGIGGSVAQWLAYAHAVQSAPDKARFGCGDVRGVLGPGAANNSKTGGDLITTVAFGVPGSLIMAILLGAFLIQGLRPGPDMLTKNVHITFAMVWIIVVANVITVAFCFLILPQLVKITYVRTSLLLPFLCLFVFLGAYTNDNEFRDILTMLLFGALGCAMVALGWPRPPLVLGLVLGKLAENYFYLSLRLYEWSRLGRPLVLVLLALVIGALAYPLWEGWRARRQGATVGPSAAEVPLAGVAVGPSADEASRATARWLHAERGFTLGVGLVLLGAVTLTAGLQQRAALFPWIVIWPTLGLVAWQFVDDLRGKTAPPVGPTPLAGAPLPAMEGAPGAGAAPLAGAPLPVGEAAPAETTRRQLAFVAWVGALLLAIWLLGFAIGGAAATLLMLRFGLGERWRVSVIYALGVYLLLEVVFRLVLLVPLFPGALFDWLDLDAQLPLDLRLRP
jgi:putative tricarboxylic transport membrane protein